MAYEWSPQQKQIFNWFETGVTRCDCEHEKLPHCGAKPGQPEFDNCEGRTSQHLIVRARAGTGKTTTIIEGANRAPEAKILLAAFNKKIAEELASRITNSHVIAKTLHSVGYAVVRRFRERIKVSFSDERACALTDQVCGSRAPDTIKRLVSKLHTKGREIRPHAQMMGDLTNLAFEFDCVPDETWEDMGFGLDYVETKALEAMELAAQIKSGETVDGSDMVFLPVRNHWLQGEYNLVIVDECQDMTGAQLEIAQGVLRKGGRICLVGDDRQAIYGFRGADSDSLDRLKSQLDAAELGLTVTYRCGKRIVERAAILVPDFEAGPLNAEGEIITISPKELVPMAGPGDFILSRVNAPLVGTAMQLLRAGKRTRVAGRDIGKGLTSLVKKFKAVSVPDFLRKTEAWESKEVRRLEVMRSNALNGRKATLEAKMEAIRDQAEMLLSLAEGAKNVTEVTDRIEALFSDDGLGSASVITCSSVHRAKGLEASRVFVLEETLRDYNREETNIVYVAYTRAKQTLVLVHPNYVKDQ